MAYKNKKQAFNFFQPFGTYDEILKLAMQTNEMLTSSAIVILHRSEMINQAMSGKLSWADPEFTSMIQEKMIANMEVGQALAKINIFDSGVKTMTSLNKPYHRKAKANSKRLRAKSGK